MFVNGLEFEYFVLYIHIYIYIFSFFFPNFLFFKWIIVSLSTVYLSARVESV